MAANLYLVVVTFLKKFDEDGDCVVEECLAKATSEKVAVAQLMCDLTTPGRHDGTEVNVEIGPLPENICERLPIDLPEGVHSLMPYIQVTATGLFKHGSIN